MYINEFNATLHHIDDSKTKNPFRNFDSRFSKPRMVIHTYIIYTDFFKNSKYESPTDSFFISLQNDYLLFLKLSTSPLDMMLT